MYTKCIPNIQICQINFDAITLFRTFAQRNVLPLLGIIPLLLSIATFVYDYYSDVDLTVQVRVKKFGCART